MLFCCCFYWIRRIWNLVCELCTDLSSRTVATAQRGLSASAVYLVTMATLHEEASMTARSAPAL